MLAKELNAKALLLKDNPDELKKFAEQYGIDNDILDAFDSEDIDFITDATSLACWYLDEASAEYGKEDGQAEAIGSYLKGQCTQIEFADKVCAGGKKMFSDCMGDLIDWAKKELNGKSGFIAPYKVYSHVKDFFEKGGYHDATRKKETKKN